MAKLVIIFACVALFRVATALECYVCDGDTCNEAQEKWTKAKCGSSASPDQEPVCERLSFKDKTGKHMVKRQCGLAPKTGEVACKPMEGATDVKCPVCKTDLCNSAPSINISFTAFAGIVLAFLSHKLLF